MYLDKIHIVDMFYVSVDTLRSDRTSTFGFRVSHKSAASCISQVTRTYVECDVDMYVPLPSCVKMWPAESEVYFL